MLLIIVWFKLSTTRETGHEKQDTLAELERIRLLGGETHDD